MWTFSQWAGPAKSGSDVGVGRNTETRAQWQNEIAKSIAINLKPICSLPSFSIPDSFTWTVGSIYKNDISGVSCMVFTLWTIYKGF